MAVLRVKVNKRFLYMYKQKKSPLHMNGDFKYHVLKRLK